jgi:hypothetical protein
LVVPYPDEPACRVWAEAVDAAAAEELADDYAGRVERIVEAGEPGQLLDL